MVGLHFALQGFRRGVSALAHASSFLYPPLLGHREGNIRPRPAAQRASAFRTPSPKRVWVPFHKAALGTWEQPSLASVPANAPSRSGERNGGFNRMYQNRISLIGFTGKDADASRGLTRAD